MDDLISRQAALDEIDRARVGLIGLKMLGAEHILVRYGRRIIEEQPTIDAVPVVRCRECKNMYEDCGGTVCVYGAFVDCITPNDFYCAFGERREE